MIRCVLFLDVGGNSKLKDWQVLGRIDIKNEITTTAQTHGRRGDYTATIFKKNKRKVWKKVGLMNYPREAYHPWEMIRRILNAAAQENGGKI